MIRYIFAVLLCLCPLAGTAQTFYPDYASTTVNDFAGLLTAEQRTQLDRSLSKLRDETGVEMTVVTLTRQATYNPDVTMEAFATGLFNHWGVGDATRNDGIMVLVLYQDRAMRIELGKGYSGAWDGVAKTVIDRSFLPKFRDNYYATGILEGVQDTIDTIAVPHSAGEDAPKGKGAPWWLAVLAVPFIWLFGGNWIKDRAMRLRSCPQCGQTGGLRATRRVLQRATTSASGSGERTKYCTNCDYRMVSAYSISRISKSSSGSSFGGGSSGGGGASGRW
ncbi:hypothetical protein ASD8599_01966 [Ascidiaceihabitans donghaensis]|uniref:TPM domain-containing protein n=1 Tax=Ascidiaceihabitans donghaensis TaxID=1510460 RepID=A0A2R8BDQ9_9RHOB|nr:TPM domain-containing protein [Ascidiaceihabitans donghaensis]SPH21217.1 hypothetical protein ASD8599_01966 [Ascidiaceihabitans donghaensis]